MRWFSNIIRNVGLAENQNAPVICNGKTTGTVAICAAGPSLDAQLPALQKAQEEGLYILACDTALPALLAHGIKPSAIVSIDCQHISYYHFIGADCKDIPLFLDLASPPMLCGFSDAPFFFCGGHPLAAYIGRKWRPFPLLDTSGGNVAHACLSIAGSLGAQKIFVYGADFSYLASRPYAKGTYIYPYFQRLQNRFFPLEAGLSSFVYRSPFLPPENGGSRYETDKLRFYRKSFEKKAAEMEAEVTGLPGRKSHFPACKKKGGQEWKTPNLFGPGKPKMSAAEFLGQYKNHIAALPLLADTSSFTGSEKEVFATLLPLLAAIKHRRPKLSMPGLIETVKHYSVNEIARHL
jgi:hypothetical protein